MKMFPSIEATDQRAWSGDRCDRWVVAPKLWRSQPPDVAGLVYLLIIMFLVSLSHRIVCYILDYSILLYNHMHSHPLNNKAYGIQLDQDGSY